VPPEWRASMAQHGDAGLQIWGGWQRVLEHPLDEPMILSHATDRRTWVGNTMYENWAKPQGLIDLVGISFARDPTMLGAVWMTRHYSRGEIGEREMAALRLIGPHFRRAVAISKLLDMKAVMAASFACALDSFAAAVLLVDERLGLVHANAPAKVMLEAGDPVQLHQGRIAVPHAVALDALTSAVAHCATSELELGQRGIGVPLRRRSGEACVAHVLPLRMGQIRPGLSPNATAAVFIAPAVSPPQLPGDALALLYDLTPAETRVFELLAGGKTQAAIAAQLGIAPSTVKTHLLKVFEKTGINRQAELVRFAASLSLPL
jgi:DNA-binding CsgD family transcriptional regulator